MKEVTTLTYPEYTRDEQCIRRKKTSYLSETFYLGSVSLEGFRMIVKGDEDKCSDDIYDQSNLIIDTADNLFAKYVEKYGALFRQFSIDCWTELHKNKSLKSLEKCRTEFLEEISVAFIDILF